MSHSVAPARITPESGERRAFDLLATGNADGAAAEVIRVNERRVRGYLRAVLRDADDADDAFSLFAEWTWTRIGRFRNEGTFHAFALGVARNAARKVRSAQRRHVAFDEDDLALVVPDPEPELRDRLEGAALRLEAVRAALPDPERALLRLRVDRRMRWKEIADLLTARGARVTSVALRKRFERIKGRIGCAARRLARTG